jgi:O-methyltransferase
MSHKKPASNVDTLLAKYPIISDQVEPHELRIILNTLAAVQLQKVAGDIVEFGCYIGTTSLFIGRMLAGDSVTREFHVYDSFGGLPAKSREDESPAGAQFVQGALAASKSQFIYNFKHAGVRLPVIHKCWFSEVAPGDVPERIAFAFLDGDYYESIRTPLELIWPHLSLGAVVVIDDYGSEALPGAKRAVDEWLRTHPAKLRVEASLAVIMPL